jgi:hypothetical protein
MAAEIRDAGTGFHRLVFKVDGGRSGMSSVTVLISQDAYRKVAGQLARARVHPMDRAALLKDWARWEIAVRLDEQGIVPSTITITASDLDEFGAYAMALARALSA